MDPSTAATGIHRAAHRPSRRLITRSLVNNLEHRTLSFSGAAESIENSLLAFDRGLANGVEMLELDCHLTKDKQAVVHHDFALLRTTGHAGYIRDTNYDVS